MHASCILTFKGVVETTLLNDFIFCNYTHIWHEFIIAIEWTYKWDGCTKHIPNTPTIPNSVCAKMLSK